MIPDGLRPFAGVVRAVLWGALCWLVVLGGIAGWGMVLLLWAP